VRRGLLVSLILALVLAGSASAARVAPADRRAIDRTIDAFVDTAVKRENVAASWNLVTPELKAGVSREAWDNGSVPVYPYAAAGSRFRGWTVDSATPTEVDFELIIPSRKSKDDSMQFNGTVKKVGGRWLIDSFNPIATFGGGAVVGPHDVLPAAAGGESKGVARLGSAWIAIPVALIAGGIVVLLVWLLFTLVRNRRARRAYRRPLEPIAVRRRESQPTLVAKERSEADA
jgi:hypothetical protein